MELIGAGLTATSTLGGLWFIVRLITHYQRDFTDQYAGELTATRSRVTDLERRVDEVEGEKAKLIEEREVMRRHLFDANSERAALRQVLRDRGIPWDWHPFPWGTDG